MGGVKDAEAMQVPLMAEMLGKLGNRCLGKSRFTILVNFPKFFKILKNWWGHIKKDNNTIIYFVYELQDAKDFHFVQSLALHNFIHFVHSIIALSFCYCCNH